MADDELLPTGGADAPSGGGGIAPLAINLHELLRRTDVVRYGKQLQAKGKNNSEIADEFNWLYGELLPDGVEVKATHIEQRRRYGWGTSIGSGISRERGGGGGGSVKPQKIPQGEKYAIPLAATGAAAAAGVAPDDADASLYSAMGWDSGVPMAMPAQLNETDNPMNTLLGAAWRDTSIGSLFSSNQIRERLFGTDNTPIDVDGLVERMNKDKIPEAFEDHFLSVKTVGQYNAVKSDIEQEVSDRLLQQEAGVMATMGSGLLVGLADPVNWLPIGRAIQMARTGSRAVNMIGGTAAMFGGSAALQEPILQATKELRDWKEGVVSIGAATLLGGILGTAAFGLSSPVAQKVATATKEWLTGPNYNARILAKQAEVWDAIQQEIANNPMGAYRTTFSPMPTTGDTGLNKARGARPHLDYNIPAADRLAVESTVDPGTRAKLNALGVQLDFHNGEPTASALPALPQLDDLKKLVAAGKLTQNPTTPEDIAYALAHTRAMGKGGRVSKYENDYAAFTNGTGPQPAIPELAIRGVYNDVKKVAAGGKSSEPPLIYNKMQRVGSVDRNGDVNAAAARVEVAASRPLLSKPEWDDLRQAARDAPGFDPLASDETNIAAAMRDGSYTPPNPDAARVLGWMRSGIVSARAKMGVTTRAPSKAQLAKSQKAFDALTAAEERMRLFKDNSMYRTGIMEWSRTIIPRILGKYHAGFLDPSDFIFKRTASVEAKLALQQMVEVNQLLVKNVERDTFGRQQNALGLKRELKESSTGEAQATGQAATTEQDGYMGRWAKWRDAMWGGGAFEALSASKASQLLQTGQKNKKFGNSLFAEAKRNGFAGGSEDYDKAVHLAVVRGYVDPNPGVQKAAELYRDNIVKPVQDLARRAGYKDMPDEPRFALGYARRVYDVTAVRGTDGHGTAFKAEAYKWYEKEKLDELAAVVAARGTAATPQEIAGARRAARSRTNQAYYEITGLNDIIDGGINFADKDKVGSPLKERVVPIPDEILIENGWISPRITDTAHGYLRTMVPQLLYADRFKTATGLPDASLEHSVLKKIDDEYRRMAETLGGDAAAALINEGKRVAKVIRDTRDSTLLGPGFRTANMPRGAQNAGRFMENLIHNTLTFQAMRLMSNLVPTSLPDLAGLAFQHGMGRQLTAMTNQIADFFKRGPLKNLGNYSRQEIGEELKRWGASIEWASNAGVAAHMDLNGPHQFTNGGITKFMNNASRVFSYTNASMFWNDTAKSAAYRATMDRILSASEKGWHNLPTFERQFLANNGLDGAAVNRIGAAWRSQSSPLDDGFLRFGYMSDWSDTEAARLLSNAIAKNRASTVIQPRIGDKNALAQSNPVLRMILQFQSFIFSHTLRVMTLAEQRTMADGFYGRDSLRVAAGLMQYVGLGMLAKYIMAHAWDFAKGEDTGAGGNSRVDNLINNRGQWIAQGIETSGITAVLGQYNTLMERAGAPGMTRVWQWGMDDDIRSVDAKDAWRDRDLAQAFGGPTISQAIDVGRVGVHAMNWAFLDSPMRRSDAKVLSEVGPWQNNIFARKFIFDPMARKLSEDVFDVAWDR